MPEDETAAPSPPPTVNQLVLQALESALPNTYWRELPPRPAWPAAIFSIETAPESAWCAGGGYDAHDVTLVVLCTDADQLDVLLPLSGDCPMRAALEGMPSYQWEVGCEDADYEDSAKVYARALIVRLRTPRYPAKG